MSQTTFDCSPEIAALPDRAGARPQTHLGWDHHQVDQFPSAVFSAELQKQVFRLSLFGGHTFAQASISKFSPPSEALFLVNSDGQLSDEFALCRHFAGIDTASWLLNLSPSDAVLLVQKGWAEHYTFSGLSLGLIRYPEGMVLLYAPRTVAEAKSLQVALRCAFAYARSNKNSAASA